MSSEQAEESSGKGLRKIGEGIGLAALIAGTVALEIHDKDVGALWVLIVIWFLCI